MYRQEKIPRPSPEKAEEIAISILNWLVENPDMLSRFLALSGAEGGNFRQLAAEPGFLAAVIDFIMGHEPDLMAFCSANDIKPEAVQAAWMVLSGPSM